MRKIQGAGFYGADGRGARAFVLGTEGRYGEAEIFGPQESLALAALEGIVIDLWEVFEMEPPEAGRVAP